MKLSIVVNHSPWHAERVEALKPMLAELGESDFGRRFHLWVNDIDYRGRPWREAKVDWAKSQWRYALDCADATHHLFMTDDLHLAPAFLRILQMMILARPEAIIGLLSNHPQTAKLWAQGHRWYRTNAWLVGPAYVMPRRHLEKFLPWFESLPQGRAPDFDNDANDDMTINHWVATHPDGPREVWHPIPTIIEHRGDLPSNLGHGDSTSRERVSWRRIQTPIRHADGTFEWWTVNTFVPAVVGLLMGAAHWSSFGDDAPILEVGGGE